MEGSLKKGTNAGDGSPSELSLRQGCTGSSSGLFQDQPWWRAGQGAELGRGRDQVGMRTTGTQVTCGEF